MWPAVSDLGTTLYLLRVNYRQACQSCHNAEVSVSTDEVIEPQSPMDIEGYCQLQRVQGAQASLQRVRSDQPVRLLIMHTCYSNDAELPARYVTEKPPAEQLEVSVRDHAPANLSGENLLNLDDAQPRDEMPGLWYRQQPLDFLGTDLDMIILTQRARVEEAIWHCDAPSVDAASCLADLRGQRSARSWTKSAVSEPGIFDNNRRTDSRLMRPSASRTLLQALGIQPIFLAGHSGCRLQHHPDALALAQIERLQRPQHTIFVNCLECLGHRG